MCICWQGHESYQLTSSQRDQIWHWGARVACLIVLPIMVYMASFKMHFLVLNHSGPGDAQMSSLFQANLVGNTFHQNPLGMYQSFPSHLCFVARCLEC